MADWQEDLFEAAKERWHTRTGLIAALGAVVVPLLIAFAGIDIATVSALEWLAISGAAGVVLVVWLRTRMPRAPRGTVGFGLAVSSDGTDASQQLYSDFVTALRGALQRSRFRHDFTVIELPRSVAAQITDETKADAVARRANLHFLLYGRARLRTLPNGPSHVLDIRGLVRHPPIDKTLSERLGQDFALALPNRMVFPADQSFVVCEFAAQHIDTVAKFIIGTAASISGDFDYAEDLLRDSEIRLIQHLTQATGQPLTALLHRVRARLSELYEGWLMAHMRHYILRRDLSSLQRAADLVPKLRSYDPENYRGRLTAALCAFVLNHDPTGAKAELDQCRSIDDAAWQYSRAFLDAYDGDLDTAYRTYIRAFSAPLRDPTVPTQCEEFIQLILDAEPSRPWLYYCLGLINYRAKEDLEAARRDFTHFLGRADETKHPKAFETARKWLTRIETSLAAAEGGNSASASG